MTTQGVIEAQAIQFWYGILDKELKRRVQDAITAIKCVLVHSRFH